MKVWLRPLVNAPFTRTHRVKQWRSQLLSALLLRLLIANRHLYRLVLLLAQRIVEVNRGANAIW